jgi:hypothetical protein
MLDRAYPKRGDTLQLPLFKDDPASIAPPQPSAQLPIAFEQKV